MKKIKSIMKLLTVGLLVAAFVLTAVPATPAYAKSSSTSSRYFKDVTKKTKHYKQVEWMAKNGGLKGIASKGKNFKPGRVTDEGTFVKMLQNLYGSRISISTKTPSKLLTQKFATTTLTSVSKQLGYRVTWSGGAPKGKVSRATACYLIKRMINTAEDGALDP